MIAEAEYGGLTYEKNHDTQINVDCGDGNIWYIGYFCTKYSSVVRRTGFVSSHHGNYNDRSFFAYYKTKDSLC